MQDGEEIENEDESDEVMEFIDTKEIEGDDEDSDEGSLVMNFQHMSVSEEKVKINIKRRKTPRC